MCDTTWTLTHQDCLLLGDSSALPVHRRANIRFIKLALIAGNKCIAHSYIIEEWGPSYCLYVAERNCFIYGNKKFCRMQLDMFSVELPKSHVRGWKWSRRREFNVTLTFLFHFRTRTVYCHHPRDTVGSLRDCNRHPYLLKRLKVSLVTLKKIQYIKCICVFWSFIGNPAFLLVCVWAGLSEEFMNVLRSSELVKSMFASKLNVNHYSQDGGTVAVNYRMSRQKKQGRKKKRQRQKSSDFCLCEINCQEPLQHVSH